MTEEEIIRNQFTSILNNLVNNKIAPTGTAILSAQQPMILLFEKLIYRINKQDIEINKLNNTIDKMAEQLAGLAIWDNNKKEPLILTDVAEVKEYFMNKTDIGKEG